MSSNKILVVITYLAKEAQGRELEFAIAGWRKHFKEDFEIVLTGENLPRFEGDDVVYVESPRIPQPADQYWGHCDYVSCLMKVRQKFPKSKGFILVADDCYAVNDFRLSDVKKLKMLAPDIDFDPHSENAWQRDKMKTKRALLQGGYPTKNFTTHLPIWYDWDKIEALWDKYRMLQNSFVVEDLYFNIYHCSQNAFMLDQKKDSIKFGVHTPLPLESELSAAFEKKLWITNSPIGYVETLVEMLAKHYGLPYKKPAKNLIKF